MLTIHCRNLAIEFAEYARSYSIGSNPADVVPSEYPSAEVIGIDLSCIQPSWSVPTHFIWCPSSTQTLLTTSPTNKPLPCAGSHQMSAFKLTISNPTGPSHSHALSTTS